jgi:hypothetical protein
MITLMSVMLIRMHSLLYDPAHVLITGKRHTRPSLAWMLIHQMLWHHPAIDLLDLVFSRLPVVLSLHGIFTTSNLRLKQLLTSKESCTVQRVKVRFIICWALRWTLIQW